MCSPPASRLVDLSGDGPARGAVHGEELRGAIAGALDRWRDGIATRTGRAAGEYVADFLGSTGHVATTARLSPDLYGELLAIAAASGQPRDDVLAYNLMDEQWRYDRDADTGCSVVATVLDGEGSTLLAQNMDLPAWMDGAQTILRIAAAGDAPDQLVLTSAGMIGLFGVNAAGLGCCVNTLTDLPADPDGLPVAVVVRELLRRRDTASAGRYLSSVPHASGQHYALADRHGPRGYECSAAGCAAGPGGPDLLHTNHALWSATTEAARSTTTHARLRALRAGLPAVRRSGDVRPLLSSPADGLCVRPAPQRPSVTFCSAQFLLTAGPPAVSVALGRPDLVPWQPIGWS
ncbi:C45 family autoproteolytic acyltransferase/hydolase [Jiangella anatolica]|uniref:6-aminopenicillanic acid acyl-transferase n=1 Tax=Jiangella anatolica TaxID=2670374 RepID=A0A2W2BFG8_9ACTN|nr:C45 family peptidase [Jiangella anatolica]PZF84742.1 6-aminopenicillanic acid acyl-transferase [Jiangella anatolica]